VSVGQILDHVPNIPDYIARPKFAVLSCWFTGLLFTADVAYLKTKANETFGQIASHLDDSATWYYFYGPIAAILLSNLVFFVMTTIRLQCPGKNVATSNHNRKKK
jgi:hypothetical protein